MEDTCKVVIDYYGVKDKNKRQEIDTGLWKLIHKGIHIETNTVPVGFNLVCEGNKINPDEYSNNIEL
jgi:hypothetical protein